MTGENQYLVQGAKGTQRRIGLEDLNGIRNGVTVRGSQRSCLHSWGFYQLRQFIEYKARLEGVQVVAVPPRGTSHICPVCGTNDRARDRVSPQMCQAVLDIINSGNYVDVTDYLRYLIIKDLDARGITLEK